MKRIVKLLAIFLIVILILLEGYHRYSHYMVSRFYDYIDAGDTEKILAHIEKMPDVNILNMCYPMYRVVGILTQNGANRGYPLEYAILKEADTSVIEALLEKGADPNKKDFEYSRSPLYSLCNNLQNGMYRKIKLLVEYGADISEPGLIPIFAGVSDLSDESQEVIFKTVIYLWENGAYERYYVGTEYQTTVLHKLTGYMDCKYVKELYHNEKRPMAYLLDEKDANGETPLFIALREGRLDNCEFLVKEGADTAITNNEGKTAYDVAVELGYKEIAELLKE